VAHPRSKSWPIIPNSNRMTCSPYTLIPRIRKRIRNGLAGVGDRRILDYAAARDFILVSTDSDFESLVRQIPGAKIVILRSCDYPTGLAADVLRRHAIRIAELSSSGDGLIILDR